MDPFCFAHDANKSWKGLTKKLVLIYKFHSQKADLNTRLFYINKTFLSALETIRLFGLLFLTKVWTNNDA